MIEFAVEKGNLLLAITKLNCIFSFVFYFNLFKFDGQDKSVLVTV